MGISTLTISELRQVARKMHQAGLSGIEINQGNYHVQLTYAPALAVVHQVASPAAVIPPVSPGHTVRAMMPGHVLLHAAWEDTPLVAPGAKVEQGSLLALIKVGVIYLPLRSPIDGVVAALAVEHGDCVEYDSEILTLQPSL